MLVFGDPKFSIALKVLLEKFRTRVQQMTHASLDELRSLLIFAGQFEQAISDGAKGGAAEHELESASVHLTDCLAILFCRKFLAGETPDERRMLFAALDRIAHSLTRAALREELVTIKIPEGYAFYALF